MKTILLLLTCITTGAALAQAPLATPKPSLLATPKPRLSAKDIRVLPFAREFKEQKFKPNDREVPDELHVTVGQADVHLYGKKRGDKAPSVQGRPLGHVGKVVLLPSGDRAGRLIVKAGASEDVTYYFAVLEMAAALDAQSIKLAAGKIYGWSVKTEEGLTTLRVMDGPAELARMSGAADGIKGVGFAATVRNKGNEADVSITLQ